MEQSSHTRAQLYPPTGLSLNAAPGSFAASVVPPRFPAEQSVGGLAEVWTTLMRHKGILVAAGIVGVALGVGLSLLQTPLYKARTALVIQNANLDFLNTRQVNPVGEEPTTDNGITDITTQIQVIGSEQILDHVFSRLRAEGKLTPLENQIKSKISPLHRLIHGSITSQDDLDFAMRQQVQKNLVIKQVGPTRAVEILYSSPDPAFAATLVNTVASEYINFSMEERLNKSKQTEKWLSGQLEEMRARLQESEAALQDYARSSGLLFASTSADSAATSEISGSKLSQLQAELSAAENDRVSAQSRYEIALSATPADLPDILNDPLLRTIQDKLTDLQRQRGELLSTYTETNERVRKIDSQIPPLQAAYATQRTAILNRIHDDYATALRRERLLKEGYKLQAGVVLDKTNKGIQYGILKRQVDSNQELYESMLEQVKRAGVASAIRASNIEVFDPAKPSRTPFSPNPILSAGLGLVGGILSGALFIFFRYRKTLHGAGELESRTGLKELGVIPNGWSESNVSTVRRRLLSAGKAASMPLRRASLTLETPESGSIELATWLRKPSFTAEAFRSVLTSILFAGEPGSRPRTITVTSANAMEGKTTLTCNLGIAMAEVKMRVLLVEGDLRNPRLHKIFRLENTMGLSTILTRPLLAAQSDLYVQSTFVPGLFVLPGGPATADAANLLHSPHLQDTLSKLRKQFDIIMIDTPPCLLATDARLLGRLSDSVIVVVRAGRTPWEEVQTVVQQFGYDRTHVLGTVLNDARPAVRNYKYYSASTTSAAV